jgi:hypothetical protein
MGARKVIRHYTWFRQNGHSPRSAARLVVFIYAKDADEIKGRMARIGPVV